MKKRILSLFLALVLTSTIGVFPAVAEESESEGAENEVILEPVGGTVTRAEIEDAIVKKILSEPVEGESDRFQVGPLWYFENHFDFRMRLDLRTQDEAETTSLTFPIELARFSTCEGLKKGDVVACGGELTRRVPVKVVEGWETPVVLFAGGEPVLVFDGTGEEVTVSYGIGALTPVVMDAGVVIGNQNMWVSYQMDDLLEAARKLSKTELVTTTLTGRAATAEEKGAFSQAYSVTYRFDDGMGNDLGAVIKDVVWYPWLSVSLPFDATLVKSPGWVFTDECYGSPQEGYEVLETIACGTHVFGAWDSPFEDVKEEDWYFPAVFDAVERARMAGTSATRFSPDGFVTREMLVTTLWRMAGKPGNETNILSYADVPEISEYAIGAFQWALEKNIIKPAGDRLNPKGSVTREMLAVILTNYVTVRGEGPTGEVKGSPKYDDADEISPWAVEGVMFAVSKGWLYDTRGMFCPQGPCFRLVLARELAMF